jgi:hypothetical protein
MRQCIENAHQAGEITIEERDALLRRYNNLWRTLRSRQAAGAHILAQIQSEAAERRRRATLSEQIRIERERDILNHVNSRGRNAPEEALVFLLEHQGQARFGDVQSRMIAIRGQAHARMERLLDRFAGQIKVTGDMGRRFGQRAADLENLVREAFGENTGDARARGFAQSWMEVSEDLRQRFNAAGGSIGRLKDWGLPQHHDPVALTRRGRDQWINDIWERLDRDRTVHQLTGQRMTDQELREALEHVYETVTTEGWSNREPSGQVAGRGALFSQHADHRFLHFKSADDWLRYQSDYGDGDPFSTMMAHISKMSRDIAFMEVLGPNPVAMFERLSQIVEQRSAMARDGSVERTQSWIKTAKNMFGLMRGSYNAPTNARIANFMQGARNLVTASSLGSAVWSAMSDVSFQRATKHTAALPQTTVIAGMARQAAAGGQQRAVRAGLILDSALHVLDRESRYAQSVRFAGTTGYIADRVLALSGLSPFTQAGKHAFGMEFQGHVADLITDGVTWRNMDPAFRDFMERNGITEHDWSTLSWITPHDDRGARYMRPQDMEMIDQDLATRYMAMIHRFTKMAVPEPTVRARAAILGETRAGTMSGEFMRIASQFKGFSVGVIFLHGMDIYRTIGGGNWRSGAYRAGGLLTTMTLLGGMALQIKEVINGKDPRDMRDPAFWAAAFLQGGGIGIYGDFLFADVNRFGGGLESTIAGPLTSRADNLRNLTIGNIAELASDKDTNFGREAVRALRENTPGGNIWYLRLAYERVFLDQLQRLADPRAHTSLRRKVQNRRRDYGQEYWWTPGQASPHRAPDLGQAVE